MAYYNVERRTLSSGEPRYKTTVFVKKNGRIVHRESKTFKKKALANTFGKNNTPYNRFKFSQCKSPSPSKSSK